MFHLHIISDKLAFFRIQIMDTGNCTVWQVSVLSLMSLVSALEHLSIMYIIYYVYYVLQQKLYGTSYLCLYSLTINIINVLLDEV